MKKLVVLIALLSASGRSDMLVSDPPPACVMRVSRITNSGGLRAAMRFAGFIPSNTFRSRSAIVLLVLPRILTTERRRTVALRRSLHEVTLAVAVDDLSGYIG